MFGCGLTPSARRAQRFSSALRKRQRAFEIARFVMEPVPLQEQPQTQRCADGLLTRLGRRCRRTVRLQPGIGHFTAAQHQSSQRVQPRQSG